MTDHNAAAKEPQNLAPSSPLPEERFHQNGGLISEPMAWDSSGRPLIARYRAAWECPLDAYRDRKALTEPEYRAGLHFRQAYYKAVRSRRAHIERLKPYPATTDLTMSEKLVKDAYDTLSPRHMGVVIDICGYDQPARDNAMLDSLRKGLGHLAVRWRTAAIEACEHQPKSI